MRVLLAGATGLVGRNTLEQLLAQDMQVVTVGRRKTGKATDEIVADFESLPDLPASDVAVSALGTTRAAAGSRAAFRRIDFDAVMAFASAAQRAGATRFIVVSSAGANASSPVFYSRVKGETEAALEALQFSRLDILQPGLLLGKRSESRPVETFLQRTAPLTRLITRGPLSQYDAISAGTVAAAIAHLIDEAAPGVCRQQNPAIRQLARDGN